VAQAITIHELWDGSDKYVGDGYGACELYGLSTVHGVGLKLLGVDTLIWRAFSKYLNTTEKYDRGDELDAVGAPRRLGQGTPTLYTLAFFLCIIHFTFKVKDPSAPPLDEGEDVDEEVCNMHKRIGYGNKCTHERWPVVIKKSELRIRTVVARFETNRPTRRPTALRTARCPTAPRPPLSCRATHCPTAPRTVPSLCVATAAWSAREPSLSMQSVCATVFNWLKSPVMCPTDNVFIRSERARLVRRR
jgi:hypothetical protein